MELVNLTNLLGVGLGISESHIGKRGSATLQSGYKMEAKCWAITIFALGAMTQLVRF